MKKIKTIEMVREIREKQYNEIKNKTNEEIIKYFKENSKDFRISMKEMAGNLT